MYGDGTYKGFKCWCSNDDVDTLSRHGIATDGDVCYGQGRWLKNYTFKNVRFTSTDYSPWIDPSTIVPTDTESWNRYDDADDTDTNTDSNDTDGTDTNDTDNTNNDDSDSNNTDDNDTNGTDTGTCDIYTYTSGTETETNEECNPVIGAYNDRLFDRAF